MIIWVIIILAQYMLLITISSHILCTCFVLDLEFSADIRHICDMTHFWIDLSQHRDTDFDQESPLLSCNTLINTKSNKKWQLLPHTDIMHTMKKAKDSAGKNKNMLKWKGAYLCKFSEIYRFIPQGFVTSAEVRFGYTDITIKNHHLYCKTGT